MILVLLEKILHVSLIAPFILFSMKNRNPESLKIVLVFVLYFIVNGCLLHLPFEYQSTWIIKGDWNWSGKIYAILGSVIFLLVYRKFKLADYYLTFKQERVFLKKGYIIIGILLLIGSIMSFIFSTKMEWDWETILFQLTLPGIDEEIAYRGIMLGLLTKVLKPQIKVGKINIGNFAILITALLFGFTHGLLITESFNIELRLYPLIRTFIMGLIWGWITIKSGSILLALISHNLGNVSDKLIRMR
ncbi:MAG: hypothetical protein A2041_11080 [Bacteroidetes bacterium GWA2_31_9b]|nr:MAG: hypothetical protein A2041_11080 [Bacteroidetes bacterium GWA2_31_9b]